MTLILPVVVLSPIVLFKMSISPVEVVSTAIPSHGSLSEAESVMLKLFIVLFLIVVLVVEVGPTVTSIAAK